MVNRLKKTKVAIGITFKVTIIVQAGDDSGIGSQYPQDLRPQEGHSLFSM